MLRLFTSILFLLNFLFAEPIDIKKLQDLFIQNVIEMNVYKKHYSTFLNNTCNGEYICLQEQIQRLKSWESVQNDNKLKIMLQEKYSKTFFSKAYWEKVLIKLEKTDIKLAQTQFVSIIDLQNQYFIIALWDNDLEQFNYIGRDLISSGNIQRETEVQRGEPHYLKTPAGIFETQLGWRSDGKTKEDNITLGYGEKDRYIFYFGKHDTVRYNTFDTNGNKLSTPEQWKLIKDKLDFALHSHKSSLPMGIANSHGCVRTTDELNRFLDNNFVLHKKLLNDTKWNHKFAKAPEAPANYDLAGKYLIVFDNI